MGSKTSKTERITSSCSRTRFSQDDLQSRATEQTDDSSLSPMPTKVSHSLKSLKISKHLSENLNEAKEWPSMLPANEEALDDPTRRRWLPKKEDYSHQSSPATDGGSKTIPVKLPAASTNNYEEFALEEESNEARYLAKMYDSRTWEMYRRITEARKNSPYQSTTTSTSCMIPKGSESTSEWENLQQEVDVSPSGHEMIFLFDFD
ncbi:unnamed protein product [Cylindrotheca closterium]|uniref:Uncharacterized protein n=1 Tax=Cylindrotheca closterium TaxID=2856 RepID=A0AAD2FM39_9STRA|nr:unnamed protein product [Cylindrotheca closterium]